MEQGYIGNGLTKEELLEEYKEGLIEMGATPEEVKDISGDNIFFIEWAYRLYLTEVYNYGKIDIDKGA